MRDFQDNAIDVIRIYAAVSVMLLHYTGYSLYVVGVANPLLQGIRKVCEWVPGVVIFFTISGFLAAHSCEKYQKGGKPRYPEGTEIQETKRGRKDEKKGEKNFSVKFPWNYFRNRAVRLLPPVWLETVCNAAVLVLAARAAFRDLIPWILTQVIGLAWTPSFLKKFATGSVNGALWTIFVQMQMYVVIALFVVLFRKQMTRPREKVPFRGLANWLILLAAAAACNLISFVLTSGGLQGAGWLNPDRMDKILSRTAVPYLVWFGVGVFLYRFRKFLMGYARVLFLLAAGVLFVWRLFRLPDPGYYTGLLSGCCVSVMALSLAYLLPKVRLWLDYTYELFLYHWIVLNVWIHFGIMERLPWAVSLLLFFLVSCGCAFAANRVLAWVHHGFAKEKKKEDERKVS